MNLWHRFTRREIIFVGLLALHSGLICQADERQVQFSLALGSSPGSNLSLAGFIPAAKLLGNTGLIGLRASTFQGSKLGTYSPSSIQIQEDGLWTLNLALQIQREVFSNWVLGLNIDCLGASFASKRGTASAQPLNLLLGGRNDRGSLLSEFFVGYRWGNHVVRTGLNHAVQEWKFEGSSEKFQRFFNLFFVSYAHIF